LKIEGRWKGMMTISDRDKPDNKKYGMGTQTAHRLLVLGSLDEFVQLVIRAKRRGYYVAVCDGYAFGPAKKYADAAYNIDVRDTASIIDLCGKEKFDGIIGSFSDILFEKITEIADGAGLKWYVKPENLRYYRDKSAAKELLKSLNIRVPRYVVLEKDFPDEALSGFCYPLVIKPLNGYGSKGIYVVHSVSEIRSRFDEVASRFGGENILVEEYSYGHEYNMMAWMADGEMHVISIADREKNPQEGNAIPLLNRVAYPSKHMDAVIRDATRILSLFAGKTGQTEGPMSMQFFYNRGGIEVCEIAGRLFGYEYELVTYCSGLDIEGLLLDYVYDNERLKSVLKGHDPFFRKYYAGLYFAAEHGKDVADLSRAYKLRKDSHVVESILFYREGETVDNFGFRPYFARYYITADNREALDAVTKKFFREMKVYSSSGENIVTELHLQED